MSPLLPSRTLSLVSNSSCFNFQNLSSSPVSLKYTPECCPWEAAWMQMCCYLLKTFLMAADSQHVAHAPSDEGQPFGVITSFLPPSSPCSQSSCHLSSLETPVCLCSPCTLSLACPLLSSQSQPRLNLGSLVLGPSQAELSVLSWYSQNTYEDLNYWIDHIRFIVFKSLLTLLQHCFCFLCYFFFFFLAWDTWDLSSPVRTQTCTPWIGRESPNH